MDEKVQIISLPSGGKVTYVPNFIGPFKSKQLYEHLKSQTFWTHGYYSMYGKTIPTPRLLWAMRDKDVDITKSYSVTGSSEWTSEIEHLRDRVAKLCQCKILYAQLNYYRDGNDYIGYHTDSEVKPGDAIASISLGAARRFILRQKEDKKVKQEFVLSPGSLLIMDTDAAKNLWKHTLPKMKNVSGRINITFRPS